MLNIIDSPNMGLRTVLHSVLSMPIKNNSVLIYSSNLRLKDQDDNPNFVFVKKDGLHVKNEQITVTVCPVVRVPVELQHPYDLPELEDGLEHLVKSDPINQCITEKPEEYIVNDTE
ncbi:hypothetical protein TNCV_3538901 [Trichonephila clavipes]|nr:hypothetical protein TNCV_3538901 [Trichonephila clavipes]